MGIESAIRYKTVEVTAEYTADLDEGYIIKIKTTQNNSVQDMDVHIGVIF